MLVKVSLFNLQGARSIRGTVCYYTRTCSNCQAQFFIFSCFGTFFSFAVNHPLFCCAKCYSSACIFILQYKNARQVGAETPSLIAHRTYEVVYLQNGDDVKTVQSNLGHATAAFTLDVYGHVSEKMKQDSANRTEAYMQRTVYGKAQNG